MPTDITRASRQMNIDYTTNLPLTQDGVAPAAQDSPLWHFLEGPAIAGEDLDAGRPVYKKASDGKWYQSQATDGTAETDNIVGWTYTFAKAGQLVAIVTADTNFGYSVGTAPKCRPVYLSATKGAIQDGAHFDGQHPCGMSNDGYNIRLWGYVFEN